MSFKLSIRSVRTSTSGCTAWVPRSSWLPLFHDAGRLTGDSRGRHDDSVRHDVPRISGRRTRNLIGADPFTFDKVTIENITASHHGDGRRRHSRLDSRQLAFIRCAAPPQRRESAVGADEPRRSGDAAVPAEPSERPRDEGAWDSMYLGYPVLETPPNRREQIDLSFLRNRLLLDNELGLRAISDDAGRAFTMQVDNRMMSGRAEHWQFRQMLYRLRGQQAAVWMPTFNRDIELSRAAASTDAFLNIKQIGYGYTGGSMDGQQSASDAACGLMVPSAGPARRPRVPRST
jgi:hypothetical protein